MAEPAKSETPKIRAVLYLRQSTYREESISLELQEHEGRAHAARMGYSVVAVEADPGISGRTWNRPAVQRVMVLVESGAADVIVLWKWSRLSRSRLDWAVAADRVESVGGRIESATEPLDTTTSTGRFARGMLTEFAAFESERIGDVWKETHARRIRQGLPANGKPRFGYVYSRDSGFTPDPVTGPVLTEIYQSYIAGQSIYSLVKELNDGPTRPVRGYGVVSDGLWSDRTLRRVLDSGFGAGLILVDGEHHPGAHPALISEAVWISYRAARERRRVFRRVERSEYLLSGLVRCAICDSPMTAGQFGSGREAKYRCKAAHEKRTHKGGYVTARLIEDYVYEYLVERRARLVREVEEEKLRAPRPRLVDDPVVALERKLGTVQREIDHVTSSAIRLGVPSDDYKRQVSPLYAERDATEAALLQARARVVAAPVTMLVDVVENWHLLSIPYKREMLRQLIVHVLVTPGRPRGKFEAIGRD